MKMIDLGQKVGKTGMPAEVEKNKVYYPSCTIDKNINMKLGGKVVCEGVVVGIRKDKYGNSTTIELRKLVINKVSEKDFEKMSEKEQEEYMESQR